MRATSAVTMAICLDAEPVPGAQVVVLGPGGL